jgi:ABC-type transport system substrate-binding protein
VPGADGIREKNGVRLVLTLIGGQIWRERAEAVQTLLRDVGIELKVELSDIPAFISRLLTKSDYDLWCYFGAYMNSGEFFTKYVISSAKLSPYRASPELGGPIDKAIVSGRAATTEAARISGYKQAQDLIAANYLFVPLVHQRCLVVYNTAKVEGVEPHGYAGNGLYKAIDLKVKG